MNASWNLQKGIYDALINNAQLESLIGAGHVYDHVPHNARWVVHCRSGVRSARASAFLQRKGYQIVNLRGGYLAWASAMEGVER